MTRPILSVATFACVALVASGCGASSGSTPGAGSSTVAGTLSDSEVCRRFVSVNGDRALSDDDRARIYTVLAVEAADKPLGAAISRVVDEIRLDLYPAAAAAPILDLCRQEQ